MAGRRLLKVIAGMGLLFGVVLGELYVLSLHFELKAQILRAQFVVIIQNILFLMSRFIWKSCSSAWKTSSSTQHERSSSSRERWLFSFLFHSLVELPPWKKLLCVFFLFSHASYLTNVFFIGTEPHFVSMMCYAALGFEFQLVTGLVIVKLLNWLTVFRQWNRDPKRGVILALLYAFLATSYGLVNAARPPSIRHIDIPIEGLPRKFENLTIVQLSDIHLGPTVGRSKLKRIVDIIIPEDPGLLVITGDLADGKAETLAEAAAPLGEIDTLLGTFFVTGNHEYYTGDVNNWFGLLEKMGFTVLHNSNRRFPENVAESICIAGVDDIEASRIGYGNHGMNLDKALNSCRSDMPVILLAHQPRAALLALQSEYRIDLILSGHTHGGQFFPLMLGAYFVNPFFLGLYKYQRATYEISYVYVSEGTQYWGIPMRIGTHTEITKLRLYRSHEL